MEPEELERQHQLLLLQELIAGRADLPSQKAFEPLLAIGPWTSEARVQAAGPGGRRWLIHARPLISDRVDGRAVDVFRVSARLEEGVIERVVRKSVWDGGGETKAGLLNEALFYAGIAEHLSGSLFRLPRLLACAASTNGATLVLEHVKATRRQADPAATFQLAEVLGEMAAISHARQLHASPFLKPLGQGFVISTGDNLLRLGELCLASSMEAEALVDSFLAVFGDPGLLSRLRALLCPCICQDDPYRRNLLQAEDGNTTVIIDWGNVRSGFVGHDAAMLLIPGCVGLPQMRDGWAFDEIAGRVAGSLLKGVRRVETGISEDQVRLGFDFAMLGAITRLGDRHLDIFTEVNGKVDASELAARRSRAADVLRYAQVKASELVRRFG